jgi:hypothetical protein
VRLSKEVLKHQFALDQYVSLEPETISQSPWNFIAMSTWANVRHDLVLKVAKTRRCVAKYSREEEIWERNEVGWRSLSPKPKEVSLAEQIRKQTKKNTCKKLFESPRQDSSGRIIFSIKEKVFQLFLRNASRSNRRRKVFVWLKKQLQSKQVVWRIARRFRKNKIAIASNSDELLFERRYVTSRVIDNWTRHKLINLNWRDFEDIKPDESVLWGW